MKEPTRDHSDADLAADLAYVRLKSGERPFKPYGEVLALPGTVTRLVPSRKIPANEATTAEHARVAEAAVAVPAPTDGCAPASNVVRLSDVRIQRKTPRS